MYSGECDVRKCEELEEYLTGKYGFLRRLVIGKTVLSRRVVAFTLGKGGLILTGVFHGAERITAMMLYKFLDDVCDKMERDDSFYQQVMQTGLTVVPMVNPDGVEISCNGVHTAGKNSEMISECLIKAQLPHKKWQANANGVDINHNFDAGFYEVKKRERELNIFSPSPTRYGGEYPESESESRALCDLCSDSDFSVAVALHSQGREIYYDFGRNTPSVSRKLAEKMAELSGYTVSHPEGIAVGGGFKDWFIERFHRSAFTIEVGLGENPLPPDIFDSEYPSVYKMLDYLLQYTIKNKSGA